MNIASVIVAVDFSDHARHVAVRAAILAEEQRAQLDLLHVISGLPGTRCTKCSVRPPMSRPSWSTTPEHAKRVDRRHRLQRTSVVTNPCVKTGRVLDEVLSASESADLLVLGAHG